MAINASVAPSYIRPVNPAGQPLQQSYVFLPGHYFGGRWTYSTLSKVSFRELLPALALGLQQQNYVPAADLATADLVVVVHWGVTDVAEDAVPPQQRMDDLNRSFAEMRGAMTVITPGEVAGAQDMTLGDAGRVNEVGRDFHGAALDQRVMTSRNAVLLGYAASLARERQRPWPSAEEHRMAAELNEGRYFVVLMAYENRASGADRKAGLLWATRLSMRAPGTNFVEAFPALVHAGGQVFGSQTDGLVRVQPKAPVPGVRLGEIQVIEMDAKTGAPPPPQSGER